jgi:hypothetical protein
MTAQYTYLLDTGTIGIDTTDLLDDVETEWKQAFGSTLDTDASTPQGTMIAAETTARTSVMKNNSDLANMQNPNLAYGTFLDAICALLGIERGSNVSTIATGMTLLGDAGISILAGARIQSDNGDIFDLMDTVVIAANGSVKGNFKSEEFGYILVPSGEWKILDGVLGWGGVIAGSGLTVNPGSVQDTDPQLKNRRNEQLAIQGTASAMSISARVLKVPDVQSVQVVENNTGSVGVVNGVQFTKPNAVWVCVAGEPIDNDVAAALYAAHNAGCAWDFGGPGMGIPKNEPDGIQVVDPITGLSYNVLYTTPILYDTYINITIHQTSAASPGSSAIQQVILDYCQGDLEGEAGLVVGAALSAFEVSGAVARIYPGLYVKSCQVAAVPKDAAAPVFPADFSYEWVANQFEQGIQQIGNITVVLV